jgi:hypothetical protein
VFVAALVLRAAEEDHELHTVLHDFADGLERVGSVVLLLLPVGSIDTPCGAATVAANATSAPEADGLALDMTLTVPTPRMAKARDSDREAACMTSPS